MNKKNSQKIKRQIEGIVISDKMDKTVIVEVQRFKKHPLYHKVLKVSKHFKAHDENNEAKIGDQVIIEETRPLSRDKRWKIVKITKRNESEDDKNENIEETKEELKDETLETKIESDLIVENQN